MCVGYERVSASIASASVARVGTTTMSPLCRGVQARRMTESGSFGTSPRYLIAATSRSVSRQAFVADQRGLMQQLASWSATILGCRSERMMSTSLRSSWAGSAGGLHGDFLQPSEVAGGAAAGRVFRIDCDRSDNISSPLSHRQSSETPG